MHRETLWDLLRLRGIPAMIISLLLVQVFAGLLDKQYSMSMRVVELRSHTVDWPGTRCYGLSQHEYLASSIPVQMNEDLDLQVAGDRCLTLWL